MAARLPTPRHCIQHSRFTKQDGWRLYDLSLSLNGHIAVTGYNEKTERTYIDVYTEVRHSDFRDKPKMIYSKEFEIYEDKEWIYLERRVSFIDDDVLVSCLGDKLEMFRVNKDEGFRSRRVNGIVRCLSVRERREILIGFYQSNKITIYDVIDLNEIKSIVVQGLQDGHWPYDMTAIADKIFVCAGDCKGGSNYKLLIFEEKNGRILSELTKPTDTVQWYAWGLALNITLSVIAVAWISIHEGKRKGKDVIVLYSLLSENNCSFLIVEVAFGVNRIRISDRGDRMITGDRVTKECKVYDMAELFIYSHLKENLQHQLQVDDCVRLTNFFALPDDQRDAILKSNTPTENFLLALEGKGIIQPSNVGRLAEALTELGIKSTCSYLVEFYHKTRLQVTPYERFLDTLSVHLTASSPADLCRYFDISDEKKDSIFSSPDPGLSLLLTLDENGIINQSEVEALEQPLSELKLVQAEAKIQEYLSFIEKGTQVQQKTTLTDEEEGVDEMTDLHKELFIDKSGGILFLCEADISLEIPAGALKDGCVLHVTVPLSPRVFCPGHKGLSRITPLIICEPDNLNFHVPVKLTLPHCAVLKNPGNHKVEVKFGHKANESTKEMTWSSEPVQYSLSKHYCTVYLNHFSGVDITIGSVEEKILRVIPYTKLGQNRKHVLNVWLCNDLESDFQNVMQSEEKNESLPLDSYDTFRLRCVSGLEDKLNIRLDVLEGSRWHLDEIKTKYIKVKKLLISTKSKCNFRLVSDGDDDESYMYFHLRVTQTVEEEETETTFALRKRICDLTMPVKFTRPSSQKKQLGHMFSTDTEASLRPFTAVVYADPVITFNDDIIITLWLWPFDSASEMFKSLQEEQELQYRHQVDTENSFSIVDEKPDIVTKTHFLNGRWLLSPEEMKIETDRIRFGSRAKFQFIGKREKSNESKYIDLQVETFQVGEETIRFIADVELNKLLYKKKEKDIEKLRAYAIEEHPNSSSEDNTNKPFQSQTKLLPSTSSADIDKEPSQSKQGVDDNIPPGNNEVASRSQEEHLRDCFMFLKKNLAGDWKDLGRCLKLVTEDDLTRLSKEHKDEIEESIYQMLLSWQRKNGALATPEMLIDALNKICRKDLADKLAAL